MELFFISCQVVQMEYKVNVIKCQIVVVVVVVVVVVIDDMTSNASIQGNFGNVNPD